MLLYVLSELYKMRRELRKLVYSGCTPSEHDLQVWVEVHLLRRSIAEIAEVRAVSEASVQDALERASLLATNGVDLDDLLSLLRRATTPRLAGSALKLVSDAFDSGDPKHLDSALKFLKQSGVHTETSVVHHTSDRVQQSVADAFAKALNVEYRVEESSSPVAGATVRGEQGEDRGSGIGADGAQVGQLYNVGQSAGIGQSDGAIDDLPDRLDIGQVLGTDYTTPTQIADKKSKYPIKDSNTKGLPEKMADECSDDELKPLRVDIRYDENGYPIDDD